MLFLILFTLTAALSADPLVVEGVVTGTEGEPLPGASVVIADTEFGTATAADGSFRITLPDNFSGERITLQVRYLGYREQLKEVTLPADSPLRIELQPDRLLRDDLVVTDSPTGSNRSFRSSSAISFQDLQQRAPENFGDALSFEPGIFVRSFGSAPSRPVIRGFDGNRVVVLENGERMGDLGETAPDHAVSMDTDAAERIEIIRGPASFLYGSGAIGGVVNLFNQDIPTVWSPGVSGRLSATGMSVNEGGSGFGRATWGGEQSAVSARFGYRNTGDIRTPSGVLPDTFNESLNGALGFGYSGDGFTGGIAISGLDQTYGIPEELDDDERVEIQLNRVNISGFGELQTTGIFDKAQARFNLSRYAHQEWEFETEPDGTIDEDLEIDFRTLTFSGSLLLIREESLNQISGALGASALVRQLNVGGDEGLTPDGRNFNLALFGFSEIPVSRALSVQAGLRADYNHLDTFANSRFAEPDSPTRSDFALSGAAGLNFSPTSSFEGGIQLARSFRTPSIEELYSDAAHIGAGAYEIGDPELRNETGYGVDLFGTFSRGIVSLDLNTYLYYISDFIYYNPTGEIHEPSGLPVFVVMADNARYSGFEADVKLFPFGGLMLSAGADYVQAVRLNDNSDLPFIPPARIRSRAIYDTGTWNAGLEVQHAFEQSNVTANEEPTAAYTLINLTAGFRMDAGGRHLLNARVDNVFNESYRSHLNRVDGGAFRNPMPGRGFTLRYQYVF